MVCNNAKTYNAPETIYYKCADKIWQYGEKAIEREKNALILEEEKAKAKQMEEDIDIESVAEGGIRGNKVRAVVYSYE